METFWYRLIQVHLEMAIKMERESLVFENFLWDSGTEKREYFLWCIDVVG